MTDPIKPNVDALRGTLDYIESHPEEWDQEVWASACGTSFCFAGTAVHLSPEWDLVPTNINRSDSGDRYTLVDWSADEDDLTIHPMARNKATGEFEGISTVAGEVLGLDLSGGDDILFRANNNFTQLEAYVEDIISGVVHEPDYGYRTPQGHLVRIENDEMVEEDDEDDE